MLGNQRNTTERSDRYARIARHFRLILKISIAQVVDESTIFQPTTEENVDRPRRRQAWRDRAVITGTNQMSPKKLR